MFSTDFIFRQQEFCWQPEMSGWIQAAMQQNTISLDSISHSEWNREPELRMTPHQVELWKPVSNVIQEYFLQGCWSWGCTPDFEKSVVYLTLSQIGGRFCLFAHPLISRSSYGLVCTPSKRVERLGHPNTHSSIIRLVRKLSKSF